MVESDSGCHWRDNAPNSKLVTALHAAFHPHVSPMFGISILVPRHALRRQDFDRKRRKMSERLNRAMRLRFTSDS